MMICSSFRLPMRCPKTAICVLLLLLLFTGTSEAGDANKRQQRRRTQTDVVNRCYEPYENATITDLFGNEYLKASFFERCLTDLQVDSDNMQEHLFNLAETFEQYYAFENIAATPISSRPQGHQPELGYSVLDSVMVSLGTELSNLNKAVQANGATGVTFLELNTIFNKLRDLYVYPPPVPTTSMVGDYKVMVFAERSLQGFQNTTVQTKRFYYKQQGNSNDPELQLEIVWHDAFTGTVKNTQVVQDINGVSPGEFFRNLADSHSLSNIAYPSTSARLNALLSDIQVSSYLWSEAVFTLAGNGIASRILPDTFSVKYVDVSKAGTFYTAIRNPNIDTRTMYNLLVNKTLGEAELNKPGAFYSRYQDIFNTSSNRRHRRRRATIRKNEDGRRVVGTAARSSVPGGKSTTKPVDAANPATSKSNHHRDRKEELRRHLQGNGVLYSFDEIYVSPLDNTTSVAAYRILDDYAVLKLESFYFPWKMGSVIWNETASAAKRKGVKKLIIDVSGAGNDGLDTWYGGAAGGGYVQSADVMAISMFPHAPYAWFIDQYDTRINQAMSVFNETFPAWEELSNIRDDLNESAAQQWISDINPEAFSYIGNLTEALIELCSSSCRSSNGRCSVATSRCSELSLLKQAVDEFVASPKRTQLVNLLESIALMAKTFNPWSVVAPELVEPDAPIRTVQRGITPENLTNQFTYFTREIYNAAALQAYQTNHFFDEYIVVSNGITGGPSAIFASKVQQMWNNRKTTGAKSPVTTVVYGGKEIAPRSGTLTAGVAATAAQDTHIDYPLIANGLMVMLNALLPASLPIDTLAAFGTIQATYEAALPVPPFFGDTLAFMPSVNYYSTFMNPGALPLQYVIMPPDEHIDQLYLETSINWPGDLAALYNRTAEFFSRSQDDSVTDEEMDVEEDEEILEPPTPPLPGPPPPTAPTPQGDGGVPATCTPETGKCHSHEECCDDMGCHARETNPNNYKCHKCAKRSATCNEHIDCCEFPQAAKCHPGTLRCVKCQPTGQSCRFNDRCCSDQCDLANGVCL